MGSLGLKAFSVPLTLGVSIILARALGPDNYGVYAFVFSLTMLLAIPAQMGLPTLVVRETARHQQAKRWSLLRGLLQRTSLVVFGLSLLIGVCVAVVTWGLADEGDSAVRATGIWALLLLPMISLTLLWGAALRGLRRAVLGQLPGMLLRPGLFLVLLGAALLGTGLTPQRAMMLHCLAGGLALAVCALALVRAVPTEVASCEPRYETRVWFRSAVAFSFLSAFTRVNEQMGIVLLGLLATKGDVGQYRVVVSVGMLVSFALTAMAAVLGPRIARLHAAGETERLQRMLTRSVRGVVAMALPIAGVFVFFGAWLLDTVFGEAYREASGALAILAVGQLVNVGMGPVGLILNMTGYERETLKGVSIAAGLNILLAVLLIPSFGILGAAIASGVSLAVWNLLLCRTVWHKLRLHSTPFAVSFAGRPS